MKRTAIASLAYRWETITFDGRCDKPVVRRTRVTSKRPSKTFVLFDRDGRTYRGWASAPNESVTNIRPYYAPRYEVTTTGGLSLEEARALVGTMCAAYGLNPPDVRRTTGRTNHGFFRRSEWTIKLPRHGFYETYVAHEVAHAITARMHLADAHGPEWLRVLIDLVDYFTPVPLSAQAMIASARAFGLSVADTGYPHMLASYREAAGRGGDE